VQRQVGQYSGVSAQVVEDVRIHVMKILAVGIIHRSMKHSRCPVLIADTARVLHSHGIAVPFLPSQPQQNERHQRMKGRAYAPRMAGLCRHLEKRLCDRKRLETVDLRRISILHHNARSV
jgi:hypothetical protein